MSSAGRVKSETRQRRWIVASVVAAQLFASPGQTYGISVFIDPMIDGLGLSRSAVSGAYMMGTLGGALIVPALGRALDRWGLAWVSRAVVALFCLALLWMSQVTGLVGLFLGFLGLRAMGQGALGLVTVNALAVWFRERRGAVMGASLGAGALTIAAWPPLAALLVAGAGWRGGWLVLAAVVALVMGPVALLGLRDPPAGTASSGAGCAGDGGAPDEGWTLARARETGAFWLLTLSGAVMAGTVTALGFHQISILGDRGLDPVAAAGNFSWQFLTVAAASWGVGRLLDRLDPRWLVGLSTGLLSVAVALLLVLRPGWSAGLYALALGGAAGSWRAVSAAAWPRWFGLAHIGSLQGASARWFVAGSALGPLPLALARDAAGSYRPALMALAALPALCAIAAVWIREPKWG